MLNPQLSRLVRRTAILGVLMLALGVVLFERSPVVRAESCDIANWNFSSCYYYCAVQNGTCHWQWGESYPGLPCDEAMTVCIEGCDGYHETVGSACNMERYSTPVVPGAECQANADRLYANCVAGPVPFAFRDVYLSCMTNNGADPSQVTTCCSEAEDHYLEVGCW